MKIVLASSSKYRKTQLNTIIQNFECFSPDIDEASNQNEAPEALAERLARQKASTGGDRYPNPNETHLVIGSDQVAWTHGKQLQKPGTRERNIEQLIQCSNATVDFYTGVAVWNSSTLQTHSQVAQYRVHFKPLSRDQIERYVDREQAFDCAGGFKMEGLGISLFKALEGSDPSSLIGLPLIQLIELLKGQGYDVLAATPH